MNKYIIKLNEISTYYSLERIKAVIEIFAHNVLFQRIICLVKPKEHINYINYVKIDDPIIEDITQKYIDDTLNCIIDYVKDNKDTDEKIAENISLRLYKKNKVKGWFGVKDEFTEYEEWILPLTIMNPKYYGIYDKSDKEFMERLKYMTNEIISENNKIPMNIIDISDFKMVLTYKKDDGDGIFDNFISIIKSNPIRFSI